MTMQGNFKGNILKIPRQLQNEAFGFAKVKPRTKEPFETNWQNRPYTYKEIQPWIAQGGNYGVQGGYGKLVIIDADTQEIANILVGKFPATFTVKTPGKGYHFYFLCPGIDKKIVLQKNTAKNEIEHFGEIIAKGSQVVGAGSIHPDTGTEYTVDRDLEIAEISREQIYFELVEYISLDVPPEDSDHGNESINIIDVLDNKDIHLQRVGEQLIGPHPIHGSTTGGNFVVHPEKKVWRCFRCQTGGGALSLIAVLEGVIQCNEAVPGGLKGDKFKQVLKIAKEKYGFDIKRKATNKGDHIKIANKILEDHTVISCAGDFYEYEDGYYKNICEEKVQKWVKDLAGDNFNKHLAEEVKYAIQTDAFVEVCKLNSTLLLNLKNGLFSINDGMLSSHSPDVYSTIRLNVNYNPGAKCDKWVKTVSEILDGDQGKIETLQEYFGLCLTKEVKYQKAMFMLGEGSNGKSTVLFILENLIGDENRTAIALEMLGNPHYVANLHNKLVNISIETNAKSEVYDAMFKAIVTGDTVEADQKFKPPFHFRPYCKLIYALNNMPRVNDKTIAFYRRLLILKFNRQFQGVGDNKSLKFELLEELDGIFLWCLEGLKRLTARKDFAPTKEMLENVEEYRRENNNVLVFVEEECVLDPLVVIVKVTLYDAFKDWCVRSGNKPLSKKKFGTELAKQFPQIKEVRTTDERSWEGITLVNPTIGARRAW